MIPSIDLDVFGDEFLADPYTYHPMLRDAGPVVRLERYGIFGIARYSGVSAVLKDHSAFCSARGVGLSDFATEEPWRPPSLLLETDPPVHDRTRALMNRVVNIASIKRRQDIWADHARNLVDRAIEAGHVDVVTEIAERYPLLVFPDTIGLPLEGREHLLTYAAAAFNAFGPKNHLFTESQADAAEASSWVASACLRSNLSEDGWGMDVYRAAEVEGFTEDEAGRLVRSFLSAGVDTTVNGIGNLLHALAEHPDQWQLLREKPELSKKAFEESLRWDSTAQTFFRTTARDVEIEGVAIPEGSKVLLFLAAANRDPRRWQDPERFDIERQASGHVGFGFGIHQCLGQMVARSEAEHIIRALLSRVAEIRKIEAPRRRLNNTLRAVSNMVVELIPA